MNSPVAVTYGGNSSEVQMKSASQDPKDQLSEQPRTSVPRPIVDMH